MAEAYSPLGGPVAVGKMEEVQLRNKAGRIRKVQAQVVPESRQPRWGYRNQHGKPGYRNLDVHGNVT